ncbi:endopeptidase La, partial [Desulfovibrio sp. OttesenSCG-928-O18]|nr:endopeptidase La [Desulfovibrio sp. OttesenSCG-928-O18]
DIHVHVPEGATPKDGPSAGITLVTSLVSALLGIPIRSDVAMTGEITLRGRVLPIGGLREKLLAAHRGLVQTVLVPKDNEKDLKDVPQEILKGLTIKLVENADEVLENALAAGVEDIFPGRAAASPVFRSLRVDSHCAETPSLTAQ